MQFKDWLIGTTDVTDIELALSFCSAPFHSAG